MFKKFINSYVTTNNGYLQPQTVPAQQGSETGQTPDANHFYISQDFKIGRESFSVTDGQNLVCVAKRKILALKEHLDVYRDDAATQLVFSIQQDKMIAMSKAYDVISADGQKMGGFKLQAMQSMMKEHWDILDSNDNPVGVIDQDTTTAMTGKAVNVAAGVLGGFFGGGDGAMGGMAAGGGLGNMIPQTFVASINGQPVCRYREEVNVGVFFKMEIDFSTDTAGLYNRTLGIAGAILLASKHMTQDN